MEDIIRGAVDRLRKYAGINKCPMAENITKFTADRPDMWLYTPKSMDGKEECSTRH